MDFVKSPYNFAYVCYIKFEIMLQDVFEFKTIMSSL